MKLYAISDLHIGYEENRRALEAMPPKEDDWLIVAGDLGDSIEQTDFVLRTLVPRFRQLVWVPGNHDLWTLPHHEEPLRGEQHYLALVDVCRQYGVLTPEDPYPRWTGEGGPCVIAPLFVLYDYTFRPDDVPAEKAIDWALEAGILGADESFLFPDPFPSREAWCHVRVEQTERRLAEASAEYPLVLVNHFPLRRDLALLPACPRFSIWCGTRRTEHWHTTYRAKAVVSGHLHIRRTKWIDGVRFEEVSLGYPHQWELQRGIAPYLREILPGPDGARFGASG